MMDSILIGLKLMAYGLGGTFLSLILLYIAILITKQLFKNKSAKKTEEQ